MINDILSQATIVELVTASLTAVLVGFGKDIVTKSINDLFLFRIHRELDISGVWASTSIEKKIENSENSEFSSMTANEVIIQMTLRRSTVKGKMLLLGNNQRGSTYAIHGRFKNNILTLNYFSDERDSLDIGSLNLVLRPSRTVNKFATLTGNYVFFDREKNKINKKSLILEFISPSSHKPTTIGDYLEKLSPSSALG